MYANRVRSLFAALPNFQAFDTAVDIVAIDAENEWMTSKRLLSSDEAPCSTSSTTTKKKKNEKTKNGTVDNNISGARPWWL